MPKTYRTMIEEGPDGELYVVIPDEVLSSLGWDAATTLDMTVENGAAVIRKSA